MAALLAAVIFLLGFIPLPQKVLDQCRKATASGPATARASLDGVTGLLEIVAPGFHRFIPDAPTGGAATIEPLLDPGPGKGGELQSLWRALDFFSPLEGVDLVELLWLSNIDVLQRGWIRLDGGGDHLAVSLGSMGESEPDRRQVWIDNDSHRLVKIRLSQAEGGEATIGPPNDIGARGGKKGKKSKNAWPWWIKLDDGRLLQLMSAPKPFKLKDVKAVYKGRSTDILAYNQTVNQADNSADNQIKNLIKNPMDWWRTLLVDKDPAPALSKD